MFASQENGKAKELLKVQWDFSYPISFIMYIQYDLALKTGQKQVLCDLLSNGL